jgi:hypothetical protein
MLDESFALNAIAAAVLLSENPDEGLVRPAYRGDGSGGSRKASALPTPLRWVTPRRKTAHPGPSPAGEWMLRGSGGLANVKHVLENGPAGLELPGPSTRERSLDGGRGFQIVSTTSCAPLQATHSNATSPATTGDSKEPSVGLEPTTPSLPWKVKGVTSVH